MAVLTNAQTGFTPDAGTVDANWQAGAWSFTVVVDGEKAEQVYAVDLVGRRVLEEYPTDGKPRNPRLWALMAGDIPDDAVECQGLVCRWRKPETLELWLAIDDWHEIDLCSATLRKREG